MANAIAFAFVLVDSLKIVIQTLSVLSAVLEPPHAKVASRCVHLMKVKRQQQQQLLIAIETETQIQSEGKRLKTGTDQT